MKDKKKLALHLVSFPIANGYEIKKGLIFAENKKEARKGMQAETTDILTKENTIIKKVKVQKSFLAICKKVIK